MNELLTRVQSMGVVPVVVLNDVKDAAPLAKALCEGGLPCAEVTFRTEAAEESIRIMAEQFPEMLIGAGTVLTIDQVDRAVAAGAKFIVSPGFDPEIVDYCLSKDILVLPGCITPSEVAQAVKRGLEVIKFFPAEQFGGVATIKALAAPYTNVKFMPTGGINVSNIKDYLTLFHIFKLIRIFTEFLSKNSTLFTNNFKILHFNDFSLRCLIKEVLTFFFI